MKFERVSYSQYKEVLSSAGEIQDSRFFCVNSVLVEYVSCDDTDYLLVYRAEEAYGPDHSDELKNAQCEENCIGVLQFVGDNWVAANSVFAELFSLALKSGIVAVTAFLTAPAS